MLAQRQPSFKECVTAHQPSHFAPKIYRGSNQSPKLRLSPLRRTGGRGAFHFRLKSRRESGSTKWKWSCRHK